MKKLLLLLLPYSASAQKSTTVKSGRWSQPSTWGGKLPKAGDSIFVNHVLTVDQSATTATITVNHGATLAFTTRSVTLDITGNLIVHGLFLDNNPTASIISLLYTGNFPASMF